jgi:hypothetical protein
MAYPSGAVKSNGQRDVGFSVPAPNSSQQKQSKHDQEDRRDQRPYHAEVLPEKASPAKTNGFAEDAFKPLWNNNQVKQNGGGFNQK